MLFRSDDLKLEEHISVSPVSPHDDASEPLSPLYSPMSSSDDLVDQSHYFSYPMQPPSASLAPVIPPWFEPPSPSTSVSTPLPSLYDSSPLPYFPVDDIEEPPVPDAIEDTSDDESDAPSTPSSTSTSSLAPLGLTSPSTPPQRTRFLPHPQVYVETDDSYFYPFEPDPLPFPEVHYSETARVVRPSTYAEC